MGPGQTNRPRENPPTGLPASVGTNAALPTTAVTAQTILQGFTKLSDGVIEMTLPVGVTIQQAGKLLNLAAKDKRMEWPVFCEGNEDFWLTNEAIEDFRTEPGRTYRLKIPTDSVSKTKSEQVRDHGEGAPLGIVCLAEACERYNTENKGTLFKDASGTNVWVRGSAPGVALNSRSGGVGVGRGDDELRGFIVAFASLVSARN